MHEKKVKSILSANNGMNLYRGCTHGCIYCDSRSKCMIGTGAMCDPYMPIEDEWKLTRRCLEIIALRPE